MIGSPKKLGLSEDLSGMRSEGRCALEEIACEIAERASERTSTEGTEGFTKAADGPTTSYATPPDGGTVG